MGEQEGVRERIERLVREGRMPRAAVEQAKAMWRERLEAGINLPNGAVASVGLSDLHHLIVDPRIWRKPWRIELALRSLFEVRTAKGGRLTGLSRWMEGDTLLLGFVIFDPDWRVWTIHLMDDKKLRKFQREELLLWKR